MAQQDRAGRAHVFLRPPHRRGRRRVDVARLLHLHRRRAGAQVRVAALSPPASRKLGHARHAPLGLSQRCSEVRGRCADGALFTAFHLLRCPSVSGTVSPTNQIVHGHWTNSTVVKQIIETNQRERGVRGFFFVPAARAARIATTPDDGRGRECSAKEAACDCAVNPGCRSIVLAARERRLLPSPMLRAALTTLSPNSWRCP